MTIQQRFLLLFADYRDMRDRVQRAEEEAVFLRAAVEEAKAELKAEIRDSKERERVWADRMARVQHGDRIMIAPEDVTKAMNEAPRRMSESNDIHSWKKRQTQEALANLDKFEEKIRNGQ